MIAPANPPERSSESPDGLSAEKTELLDRVRSILQRKLSTRVTLSEREVSIEALQNYSVGSLIVLKDVDPQRLRLEVEGVPIAEGQTVRIGDKLALRIDRVLAPREILERLEMAAPSEDRSDAQAGESPERA